MKDNSLEYQRRRHYLCAHLDREIYKILSQNPMAKWEIAEIQDKIEGDWDIRPYRATILRHALSFYCEHHIPLFYKTSFSEDTYRLNTEIGLHEWEEFFKPKPRGRPRKNNNTKDNI